MTERFRDKFITRAEAAIREQVAWNDGFKSGICMSVFVGMVLLAILVWAYRP